MKVIVVRNFNRPFLGGNLNMRELLNPLFFTRTVKHPDRKRQRVTKQRDRAIQAARELKHMEVPRNLIPPVELYEYDFDSESWVTADRRRRRERYWK